MRRVALLHTDCSDFNSIHRFTQIVVETMTSLVITVKYETIAFCFIYKRHPLKNLFRARTHSMCAAILWFGRSPCIGCLACLSWVPTLFTDRAFCVCGIPLPPPPGFPYLPHQDSPTSPTRIPLPPPPGFPYLPHQDSPTSPPGFPYLPHQDSPTSPTRIPRPPPPAFPYLPHQDSPTSPTRIPLPPPPGLCSYWTCADCGLALVTNRNIQQNKDLNDLLFRSFEPIPNGIFFWRDFFKMIRQQVYTFVRCSHLENTTVWQELKIPWPLNQTTNRHNFSARI